MTPPRPPRRTTARCAMNAETIAKALGGRKAGGDWMARCPAHEDREPSLSISDAQGRQGARALPCRMRSARRDRRTSLARPVGNRQADMTADSPRKRRSPASRRTRSRRPEAHRGGARHLAGIATGRGNAGRDLSALARARPVSLPPRPPLSCRIEAPLGRRLARDGGARDARRGRGRRSPFTAPSSPATAAARRRSIRRR